MFLLNHVAPEKAQGEIAEAYHVFPKSMGVPAPLQLLSASPGLLKAQLGIIGHFQAQTELDFPLLTAIRYTAARMFEYQSCIDLNYGLLKSQGMTEEEIEAMYTDPRQAPFEDREKAMYEFVVRSLKDPEQTTGEDIDALKGMGWSEAAILDAMSHGAIMLANGTVFKTFMKK